MRSEFIFREDDSMEQSNKPKLLDQVRMVARARHLSNRTEDTYHNFIKRYILFHNKRHPAEMAADEITAFLTDLAVRGKVSASTQNQALFAILFLYRDVLAIELPRIEVVVRAKRPEHLPVVFTPTEAKAILANLTGVPILVASLLYGARLRLHEALRPRVKDLDKSSCATVKAVKTDSQYCRPNSLNLCKSSCSLHKNFTNKICDTVWGESKCRLPWQENILTPKRNGPGNMFSRQRV